MSGILDNKVVFISGSSRGIGAAIAKKMSEEGAKCILTFNSSIDLAEQVAAQCANETCIVPLDVTDMESCISALGKGKDTFGRIDIFVNNAGYLNQMPFQDIDEYELQKTIDINLKGVFYLSQLACNLFGQQGSGGNIINISSIGGQIGGTKALHYAATKSAVISMTKSTARILAESGGRVNAIAPGFIKTEMYDQILKKTSEKDILSGIPLGFVGLPEDIAEAALFLASDSSRYITGHVLNVNGGAFLGS